MKEVSRNNEAFEARNNNNLVDRALHTDAYDNVGAIDYAAEIQRCNRIEAEIMQQVDKVAMAAYESCKNLPDEAVMNLLDHFKPGEDDVVLKAFQKMVMESRFQKSEA